MENFTRCLSTPKNAKDYIAQNDIPQLFECLMTGLMYHRPTDHIEYMHNCLDNIKKQGINAVRWDMFLEAKKAPLPPIPVKCTNDKKKDVQEVTLDNKLETILPHDCEIIFVIAGPGLNKHQLVSVISENYPRFQFIQLGRLIREKCIAETNKNHTKWKVAFSLLNSGELIQDELALDVLIRELKHLSNVSGLIIEGFPRNMLQLNEFEKAIGLSQVRFALLVDTEEETCYGGIEGITPSSEWIPDYVMIRRVTNYKAFCLPACKELEYHNKLKIVDGDRTADEIQNEIRNLFRTELTGYEDYIDKSCNKTERKPAPQFFIPAPVTDVIQITDVATEINRPHELPQCPYVVLFGGPGCGKTSIASHLCQLYENWTFINVYELIREAIFDKGIHTQNWDKIATLSELDGVHKQTDQLVVEHWNVAIDLLKKNLQNLPSNTKGIIFEGFPKDEIQLDEFHSTIGRVDLVILVDCDEVYMLDCLSERSERLHRPEDDLYNVRRRIHYYKKFTLPLLRYFDEQGRLNIVKCDRKLSEVTTDLVNLFEAGIMKKKCVSYKDL